MGTFRNHTCDALTVNLAPNLGLIWTPDVVGVRVRPPNLLHVRVGPLANVPRTLADRLLVAIGRRSI